MIYPIYGTCQWPYWDWSWPLPSQFWLLPPSPVKTVQHNHFMAHLWVILSFVNTNDTFYLSLYKDCPPPPLYKKLEIKADKSIGQSWSMWSVHSRRCKPLVWRNWWRSNILLI
jgi:hypothetical protein